MTISDKITTDYRELIRINPKDLSIRKKLDIFIASDKNEQSLILHISQKSRFLKKDSEKIEEIYLLIQANQDINSKIILIESPLCSKAKALLEEFSWKVIV
jgi:hypothetical protein